MASYTRQLLSGSTNGREIPVAAVATPGTLIHTAVAGTFAIDQVWLWAANVTANARTLTVEFGGVTDPGDHLVKNYTIPPYSGRVPICTGEPLQNGLAIRAFGDVASAINVGGYALRIQ